MLLSTSQEAEKDWANPMIKEAPFWYDGMSPEEYITELEYYDRCFQQVMDGTYVPLWKQKKNK